MARRLDGVDAAMTVLVLMWGTAFVSIKVLGRSLDPFEMTWFRYVPFLAFYGVWLVIRRRDRFRLITGNDWVRFAVAGSMAVIGYHVPLNWAMSSLTPGTPIGPPTAAILVATTPLWTLLFAVVTRQERLTRGKWVGSVAAFAGVILVVLVGTSREARIDVEAKALIALVAPLLWAGYSIVAKPLITRYGGLFVTGVTMNIGTLSFLPFGVSRGIEPLRGLDGLDWFWLAYLALAGTLAGYTIWNQALKRRTASEVTVYIFAVPVVATLASVVLVGERITIWFVLGAALVLGGLAVIHRARVAPAKA